MATKLMELEMNIRGEGCLGRARLDEPLFVLRAKDPIAAAVVRQWVLLARAGGLHSEKLAEAELLADRMESWRRSVYPAPAPTKET